MTLTLLVVENCFEKLSAVNESFGALITTYSAWFKQSSLTGSLYRLYLMYCWKTKVKGIHFNQSSASNQLNFEDIGGEPPKRFYSDITLPLVIFSDCSYRSQGHCWYHDTWTLQRLQMLSNCSKMAQSYMPLAEGLLYLPAQSRVSFSMWSVTV